MISNSEQLNTQDVKNEKVEELTVQENLEPTEAQVEEIIQKMEADISKEENQILESVDERIEKASTSSNIDPEKAESIFNIGGFAEKINLLKEKIKTLTSDAKDKIKSFVSTEPEVIHFKDMISEPVLVADENIPVETEIVEESESETIPVQDIENQDEISETQIEKESSRFYEKITNPEAKAILEENSEKFQRDTESFKNTLKEKVESRTEKVAEFKENLKNKLYEIRKAREEIQNLSEKLEKSQKEIVSLENNAEKYKTNISELSKGVFSRLLNKGNINSASEMANKTQEEIREKKEEVETDNSQLQELMQRVKTGDLSAENLTFEERKALTYIEYKVGRTTIGINPQVEEAIGESVEVSAKDYFLGERGKFTEENSELLHNLNRLKNELVFGSNARESFYSARNIEETEKRATQSADEDFQRALNRYNEKTYEDIAGYNKKSVEETKKEIYDKLRKEVWEKTHAIIYSGMSGDYRASMELIGLKESDMDTYLQTEKEVKEALGVQFEGTSKKDFEYARYRAYFEARRTGENIFTHVTSGERAEKIIGQHALKSSKVHTPEEMRQDLNALSKSGQTANSNEENIYFTSGGGGFDYGTKSESYQGQAIKREASDFAFFATTGNDILASGKSVEVANPTLLEKGESLRGRAVGSYESVDGTEVPLESLQLIIPESEINRYTSLFENAGYDSNFAKEHLIGVPNEVVQEALIEGNGLFKRDSQVLHEYVNKQLKRELKNRSKNKDKIFATVAGRESRDAVSGGMTSAVLKWQQIN